MPQEITIYRGILDGHLADGMSWTLDRDKAIWFATRFSTVHKLRPVLLTARAEKSDAHALLLGRQEDEIVIDRFVIAATEYVARWPGTQGMLASTNGEGARGRDGDAKDGQTARTASNGLSA